VVAKGFYVLLYLVAFKTLSLSTPKCTSQIISILKINQSALVSRVDSSRN